MPLPKRSEILDKINVLKESPIAGQYDVTKLHEAASMSPITSQGLLEVLGCLHRYVPYREESVLFYQGIIQKNLSVEVLEPLLSILKKAGITYSIATQPLFVELIKNPKLNNSSEWFDTILSLLSLSGLPYSEANHDLYLKVFGSPHTKLTDINDYHGLFDNIRQVCSELEDCKKLLILFFEYPAYDRLAEGITQLNRVGFSYSVKTEALYRMLFQMSFFSKTFNISPAIQAMEALKKLIPCHETTQFIYAQSFRFHHRAEKFSEIFKIARHYGFDPEKQDDMFLYVAAIQSDACMEDLDKTFEIIKEIRPICPHARDFYGKLLHAADIAPKIFEEFKTLGCVFEEETFPIYEKLIGPSYGYWKMQPSRALIPLRLLESLKQINCFYSKNTKKIYDRFVAGGFNHYIISLANSGFQYTPETHDFFYSILLRNYCPSAKPILRELFARGYPCSVENQPLYNLVLDQCKEAGHRFDALLEMLSLFLPFQSKSTPELFAFLMQYPNVFLSHGFDLSEDSHVEFLESYGEEIADLDSVPPFSEFLLEQVQEAFDDRPELGSTALKSEQLILEVFGLRVTPSLNQSLFINSINAYKQSRCISNGPLIYNQSTTDLQALIAAFAENPKAFQLEYDKALKEYMLRELDERLQVKREVNLSLLLQNANLSQLMPLDDEMDSFFSKLGVVFEEFAEKNDMPTLDPEDTANEMPPLDPKNRTGVVAQLPKVLKEAIFLYTETYYTVVNPLLRGEAYSSDIEHEPLKCAFLIGMLVTYAVNMLPSILHRSDVFVREKELIKKLIEKDIPLKTQNYDDYVESLNAACSANHISKKEYELLEQGYPELVPLIPGNDFPLLRSEQYYKGSDDSEDSASESSDTESSDSESSASESSDVEEIDVEELMTYRTAGVTKLPALTSTSYFRPGYFFNSNEGNVYITFENPANYPSIALISRSAEEDEVILPPGLQVIYLREEQGLSARIVSSPDFDDDQYWPQHALRYAYLNHLSKPYTDKPDAVTLDETIIHRPIHGLAHTQRVMSYIRPVIEYCAMHAKDKSFRTYCRFVRNTKLEHLLKIAAAFSVTGRESEVSFKENPRLYKEYQQKSRAHFLKYTQLFPESMVAHLKETIGEIIEAMEDPHYPAHINKTDAEKLYCYYILFIAHQLDLPRSSASQEVQEAFSDVENLFVSSDLQQLHLSQLQRYALDLIAKHGDKRRCYLREDSEWIAEENEYQTIFSRVSQSPKKAEYYSGMVRKPLFFEDKESPSSVEKALPEATEHALAKRKPADNPGEAFPSAKSPRLFQPSAAKRKTASAEAAASNLPLKKAQ